MFFILNYSFASSIIYGKVSNVHIYMSYFKPFENFSNEAISEKVKIDSLGYFTIGVNHISATMIKLQIDSKYISLFLEPGDSIHIILNIDELKEYNKYTNDEIAFKGINAEGIYFYNIIYNAKLTDKFLGLKTIFAKKNEYTTNQLLEGISKEFQNQTNWIDSLLAEKEITVNFSSFFKTEINVKLIGECCRLIKQYFEKGDEDSRKKGDTINKKILEFIDIDSPYLNYCLSMKTYYFDYYGYHYKVNTTSLKPAKILPEEFTVFELAPTEIRKYLVGSYIINFKETFPTLYDYCSLYKQYIEMYNDGELVEHMKKSDVCGFPLEYEKNIKILYLQEDNIQSLIDNNFKGSKLYIDLWATWCIPCKVEFKYYDNDLLSFFDKYNITNLFISIDEDEKDTQWKQDIYKLNLKGYHIRANEKLIKSIKEKIFSQEVMSIPRYVLVDEKGEIININANRPNSIKSQIPFFFNK